MNRRSEKGVALVLSILALLLLTAIAAGMMYMSTTETSVNNNFKSEEKAYFAARAGVEEVRDRMLFNNPSSICPNATPGTAPCILPSVLPSAAGGVLYILQNADPATGAPAVTMGNVTNNQNPFFDDELCHDFAGYGTMTAQPANVRCTTLPGGVGGGWYTSAQSALAPYPLDYKWVRVTLKANNSTAYPVDGAPLNAAPVCWDGISEKPLPAGTLNCAVMNPVANPVYMVTALAVSPNGARRLVQQELAQTPTASQPGGLFATGMGCGALSIGGNAKTHSFNSSNEPGGPANPPGNAVNSNGDVGANGSLNVNGSSTKVNGKVSSTLPPSIGLCPANAISVSGGPTINSQAQIPAAFTAPVPPMPNPLPPTTAVGINSNTTWAPSSRGNVSVSGHSTLTLQGGTVANPAVYTFNSLSFSGNSTLDINPPGPVIINIAGIGQTTVVDFTGGNLSNTTYVPADLTFNYGGTGNMIISGGSGAYAVINAPNAALSFHGGSNFYGQAIAATIDDSGGTDFYWDTAANTPPPNANSFYEISLRELSY
jgi:hypothetical protein